MIRIWKFSSFSPKFFSNILKREIKSTIASTSSIKSFLHLTVLLRSKMRCFWNFVNSKIKCAKFQNLDWKILQWKRVSKFLISKSNAKALSIALRIYKLLSPKPHIIHFYNLKVNLKMINSPLNATQVS